MKDIELPPMPDADVTNNTNPLGYRYSYSAIAMQAYARAAVEADRAQRVPDDFLSHRSAWRAALVIAQGFAANEDDSDYWSHEIKAFDRAYSRLLASTQAPAQQEPKEWLPTAENINMLPEPVRRYISDLETNCDPAGTVRHLTILQDTVRALEASNRMLRDAAQHQAPPQQERKPLTDEQIYGLYKRAGLEIYHIRDSVVLRTYDRCINDFARAIEQAHGIKE